MSHMSAFEEAYLTMCCLTERSRRGHWSSEIWRSDQIVGWPRKDAEYW